MEDLLRKFILEALLDSSEDADDSEEELDEFSGVGSIVGMTLPLGASPGKVSEPYVVPSRKLGNVKKNKK